MRKNKKNYLFLVLTCIFLLLSGEDVEAAESRQATVSIQKEQSENEIHCKVKLENGKDITSGKIRIAYNNNQLKLKKTESDTGLENALSEINDCIVGNKPEGEIVMAFAASESIPQDGDLLKMDFEAMEGVKGSDEITIDVKVVDLAGNQGAVNVITKNLTFSLDGKTEQSNTVDTSTVKTEDKQSNTADKSIVKTGDNLNIKAFLFSVSLTSAIVVICIVISLRRKHK